LSGPSARTRSSAQNHTSPPSYEIYNLLANRILAANSLAQVGSEWGFVTLGNFNLDDPSDLLRNSTNGEFRAYDIVDNNVIDATALGTAGVEWQPMGFGNLSARASDGRIWRWQRCSRWFE
jgi:hypothetical protein